MRQLLSHLINSSGCYGRASAARFAGFATWHFFHGESPARVNACLLR